MVAHEDKRSFMVPIVVLVIIIVVAQVIIFLFPIDFEKYTLSIEKVQYNEQESYQEIVNRDNCESSPSCVCSKRGGFLWLTCVQCSCTRERTVVKEKLVLKEGTTAGQSTLYKKWTNSMVSQNEARQNIQTIADFGSQTQGIYYNIMEISKGGDYWKAKVSFGNSVGFFYVEGNTGKVLKEDLTPINVNEANR